MLPDTRLRSDALADDALAFLKPLVVGVWGAVAVVALANAAEGGTALSSASRIEPASSLDQRLQSHFAQGEQP